MKRVLHIKQDSFFLQEKCGMWVLYLLSVLLPTKFFIMKLQRKNRGDCMAFFDLNQNKRKDAEEEYMAYQILRGMTEDEDSEESEDGNFRFVSGEDGGFGFWLWFSVAMIVIGILGLIK